MLKEKISSDLKEAQKNRDAEKVSALRMVLAAIHNQEIEKKRPASDEDVMAVLSSERKKHLDSIDQFTKGDRADLVEKERGELAIIKAYLPEELSEAELKKIVVAAVAETKSTKAADFGKVMKVVMSHARGRADGVIISKLVKDVIG